MAADDRPRQGSDLLAGIDFARASEEEIEAAVVRLGSSGQAALPVLKALLASPEADIRWWGVRALALPSAGASDWAADKLILALADPDPAVRQCAALSLRQRKTSLGLPAAISALIPCLSSSDALLRRLAGDALAEAGSLAVPALIETLEKGPDAGRGQAARALALIADPRSIPALFAVLDDPSSFVSFWANQGLDAMGVGMMFFNPSG